MTAHGDNLTKTMVAMFYGIHEMSSVNWLPQGASFNGAYFSQEFQPEGRAKRRPWTLLHMVNVKLHTSKWQLARM
jgi:hypothetical protein